MDIKWEWIIIVDCDAVIAVVDVVVSIIAAATAVALLFTKWTKSV